MGFSANYEVSKKPGSLNKAALAERHPKGATGGTTTKTQKLGVSVNIVTDDDWADIQRWFPGSDHVAKMLSQHDAPGLSWTCSRKLGEINLIAHDVVGKELFVMKGAAADQPTIHISAGGKSARVSFLVEGEVPPEKARTIRDYYRADVLWGWGNAQTEIETGAQPDPATPKRTGGRKKKKTDDEVTDDAGEGGEE